MTKAYEFNWIREVPDLLQTGSCFELIQDVSDPEIHGNLCFFRMLSKTFSLLKTHFIYLLCLHKKNHNQ